MRRVIKIGTSTILTSDGTINMPQLQMIAHGVMRLMRSGDQITVVTSGAVGIGRQVLSAEHARRAVRQTLAAVGQPRLIQIYQEVFGPIPVAQLLVDPIHVRHPYASPLQAALQHLWDLGIVPLANENDTLSGAEHGIGDNDTLAALVAGIANAEQLVILSDIDGLYTDNPSTNPQATRVPLVSRLSPEHFGQFGAGTPGPMGSGGIVTKLRAAHIAQTYGIETVLASGRSQTIWDDLIDQRHDHCTRFLAHKEA